MTVGLATQSNAHSRGDRGLELYETPPVAVLACFGAWVDLLETAKTMPGKATAAGASRFAMNSRKRMRAASCGTPKSSLVNGLTPSGQHLSIPTWKVSAFASRARH
jgi:hypothetical protein